MKARRFREGRLTGTEITAHGASEIDPDALGVVADLPDFLAKVRRLRGEITAPKGSLRAGYVEQIEYLTKRVEDFTRGPKNSPEAELALLYMLHAAANYVHLLAEIADDVRADPRRRVTRSLYLEAAGKARTRTELAQLLRVSPQGLRLWEDEHLAGRRWNPPRRATAPARPRESPSAGAGSRRRVVHRVVSKRK
jgi:hypothetical protein